MFIKGHTLILLIFSAVVLAKDTSKLQAAADNVDPSKEGPQPLPTAKTTSTTPNPASTTQASTTTTKTTPSPTTSAPTTTTPAITTSTTSSTTSTTIAPSTSTPAPATTTHAPSPQPQDWIVQENTTVCIIANMVVKVNVPYPTINNKTHVAELNILNVTDAKANGTCGKDLQTLILTSQNLTATFNFTRKNNTYSLSGVEFGIFVNNHTLPNNSLANVTQIVLKHGAEVFSLPLNHSYTCASVNPLNLNGTAWNKNTTVNGTISGSLTVSNVHVEAFGVTNKTVYSAPMDCASSETPDIVPIVVGLILAGLVVVVLIAYLVGRRRAQARGYLSM